MTMRIIAVLLVAFVALSHMGMLILEMFLWNNPLGQRVFEMTPEYAASTAVLAENQGFYNGLLAIGMIWGLLSGRRDVKIFFLCCALAAGVFGGLTAKMSILYVQGALALVALLAVLSVPPPRQRHRL
jgi:putative membrane protein